MYFWLPSWHKNIFDTTDGESQKHKVSHGVPHGSVLSPTLPNAIMAHLPCRIPSFLNISLYAGDLHILASNPSSVVMQHQLQ